jgi:hypothetical protein
MSKHRAAEPKSKSQPNLDPIVALGALIAACNAYRAGIEHILSHPQVQGVFARDTLDHLRSDHDSIHTAQMELQEALLEGDLKGELLAACREARVLGIEIELSGGEDGPTVGIWMLTERPTIQVHTTDDDAAPLVRRAIRFILDETAARAGVETDEELDEKIDELAATDGDGDAPAPALRLRHETAPNREAARNVVRKARTTRERLRVTPPPSSNESCA